MSAGDVGSEKRGAAGGPIRAFDSAGLPLPNNGSAGMPGF